MANVFISYARDDAPIARRIANDLRALGTTIWLDQESISYGQDLRKAIYEGIERADAILVLISPASLRSKWVEAEWQIALAQQNKRVLPALVGGATFTDLPLPLSNVQGVDLNKDYEENLRRIHAAIERLDSSTAPSVAESIDVAQIVDDVTRRVLKQLEKHEAPRKDPAQVDAVDDKLIFVISSFHPDMEPSFEAIAAAAAAHGLRAERVKDAVGDYRITEQMLSMIRRARFVVADLTHERPNVYFELGYARGVGKKVVSILREGTERHFDVYDWNYISYIDSRPLERALRDRFHYEINASNAKPGSDSSSG